jgi:hypothetical protein
MKIARSAKRLVPFLMSLAFVLILGRAAFAAMRSFASSGDGFVGEVAT